MTDASRLLGSDAVTGEPAVVRAVADHLRAVSANVDTVRSRLLDQDTGGWSGDAADAFRSALEELPDELCKLTTSYDAAASTVSSYASTFEALRSTSTTLAAQIEAAEQRQHAELDTKASAQSDVERATHAHACAADPVAGAAARNVLERATLSLVSARACVTATQSEIAALRRKAHDNRVAFEDAVKACCNGLDAASDAGIRNSLGTWYDRHIAHGGPIGELFDALVVAPFRDTVEALKAFIDDPSWANASALLGGIGDVLALVGGVVLLAALGLGSGGMVFALGGLLLAGSRGATWGKAGVDSVRVGRGEAGAEQDLAFDGIGLVVPRAVGERVAGRPGGPKALMGAGERLARQEARFAAAPSPGSQGWVTRRLNDVRPHAFGEQADVATDVGLDLARSAWWAPGAGVTGTTCPAPGPMFSPSVTVRHPIAAAAP